MTARSGRPLPSQQRPEPSRRSRANSSGMDCRASRDWRRESIKFTDHRHRRRRFAKIRISEQKDRIAMFNRRFRCALVVSIAVCILPLSLALGQSVTATLSGAVVDEKDAVIAGAKVTIVNVNTGTRRNATTNDEGYFTIPLLPPSAYTVTVEREGFAAVEIKNVVLNVNDQRDLKIQLKVATVGATVDVVDNASSVRTDAAVGTIVDRQFVENLPLNGRSFQSLITLSPGVVLTRATNTEQGQFSVNGQRADANYFTIDGAGANVGVFPTFTPGQSLSGAVPALAVTGGTNNLVSVEALQEFKIQTSTFAPEFGRTPGAQVSIVTRSGTNSFHGALYEYLRNDALDANDWFANANRQGKPPLRQNNFGVAVGGPILLPRFGEGGRQ